MAKSEFEDIATRAGYEIRSYSGRGMYGKECVAIVADDISELTADLVLTTGSKDIMAGMRRDSMGLSYVAYWPNIEWKD